MSNRRWTAEEDELLAEHWGHMTVPGLCQKLGRSENAIIVRVHRLKLPPYLEAGEYISFNQLIRILTGHNETDYHIKSWVEARGLPVRSKRCNKSTWRVVRLDDFWQWAEKNRSFIDFTRMEPLALGKEPDWVAEQRRWDHHAHSLQRKDPWTAAEDERLQHLLQEYRYSRPEIAEMLHRSEGAVERRCCTLGIKARPLRADCKPWSDAELEAVVAGIKQGHSYALIAETVGRSEKAVRGRVWQTYRTEDADRVRAMLRGGGWGCGKPTLTCWELRRRAAVRKDIERLVDALKTRINVLEYGEFWQRKMCVNWDDVNGCAAGCDNCDNCDQFRRMTPQYCRQCGAAIWDHKIIKWRLCDRCLKSRRRQYFRKQAALSGSLKEKEEGV